MAGAIAGGALQTTVVTRNVPESEAYTFTGDWAHYGTVSNLTTGYVTNTIMTHEDA